MGNSSLSSIRQHLRRMGEATRPELAAASGFSLVTVGRAVAILCREGEVSTLGLTPSGGGRPVLRYRYEADYACHALIQLMRAGNQWQGTLELLNLRGESRGTQQKQFAYIEEESLDGWLDRAQRRHRLQSMTLCLPPDWQGAAALARHLGQRYPCPVHTPSPAALLAAKAKEGTATLYLAAGSPPSCAIKRHGYLEESPLLSLLPLPVRWEELDYTDHTLVEEMLARLLHIITCTLSPARFTLYTPPWSSRLMERIRFNSNTKLQGKLPPLTFRPCTPATLSQAARTFACQG